MKITVNPKSDAQENSSKPMKNPVSLVLNKPYPGALPPTEGAVLNLFTVGGGQLLIAVSGLSKREIISLRRGKVRVGMLHADSAILLAWRFLDEKQRPVFTFDTPFDARKIPLQHRDLPSKTADGERLTILITVVDHETGIIKGLRLITLPLELSDRLISTTMEQLAHPEQLAAADIRTQEWSRQPLEQLAGQIAFQSIEEE